MSVTYSEETLKSGARKVALVGMLDSAAAAAMAEELEAFISGKGGQVIVDMSGLDFIASSGLRVLLVSAKALYDSGGQLHLAAPNPRVMSVLDIAGYVSLFPVYKTLDEAIAAVGG